MLADFTQSQVRDLLAIAPETMRHWRKVFEPLSNRRRRAKFSPGDLVALATIRELVRGVGINSSALAPRANEIFDLCNSQAWHALSRQRLQIEKHSVSLVPARSALLGSSGPIVCLALGPIIEQLSNRVGRQVAAQIELDFPLVSVRKRRP
jgi:hypothetical protein